jgi:lipopolysaccharide export system protein LptA
MKRSVVIIALILLTCLAVSGAHAASESRKATSNLPITIKSNDLTADNKGKTALFTGKVVAKQGDVTIFCDRMTVYYGAVQGDIDRIEADGNVRIVQENRTGTAAHAVYESREGRITLTGGNPKVMQGTDTVSGKIITYLIDDDRSSVSGGGDSRVEAVINPKQKTDSRPKKGNADKR